ncbi:MAG TPA: hypothetical protein VGW38_21850 [Chloroflexota bacterium]|nr:hypothetical protein [Chloroflexota bacterium]
MVKAGCNIAKEDRKAFKGKVTWRMGKLGWEAKARAAFERYIEDIKVSLPADASFAEMERAVMKFSPEIMRSTLKGLAASEDFSPEKKAIPEGYWRNGRSHSHVNTNWGKVEVLVQRLKSKTGEQRHIYLDASLDESGWSPEALVRIVDLGTRLPYEEASLVASRFGLEPSRSLLNALSDACTACGCAACTACGCAACASSCQRQVLKRLEGAAAIILYALNSVLSIPSFPSMICVSTLSLSRLFPRRSCCTPDIVKGRGRFHEVLKSQ